MLLLEPSSLLELAWPLIVGLLTGLATIGLSMVWEVPTAVLGTSITASPQSTHQESSTNLAAAGTWQTEFETEFSPLFDVFLRAVGTAGSLELEVRLATTGTYRSIGTWPTVDGQLFSLTGYRVPGIQVRWTFTATGATTTFEGQIFNRSA